MKRFLFITLALLSTLTSCNKLPVNGHLDGLWQLMQIEDNEGNQKSVKDDKLYYAFQLQLMGLQDKTYVKYLGRFQHTTDSLFVYDFRLAVTGDNSTEAVPGDLAIWGIDGTDERFGVEQLTDERMVLKSKSRILSFRKF